MVDNSDGESASISAGMKRTVLRSAVGNLVLQRLSGGMWRPGTVISIDGLARELQVSPTPVREALISLERSGLIHYRALRGYVVAEPLTPKQVVELIDARKIIESAALSRALRSADPAFLASLRERHSAHQRAAERSKRSDSTFKDFAEYFEADLEFHRDFFRFADNEFLADLHESLGGHGHRMRQTWEGGAAAFDFDDALAEHSEILAYVEERNHDGSIAALQAHLQNVQQRSLARIPDADAG